MALTREHIEPSLERVRNALAELLGRDDEPAVNRIAQLTKQEAALTAELAQLPEEQPDTPPEPRTAEEIEDDIVETIAQRKTLLAAAASAIDSGRIEPDDVKLIGLNPPAKVDPQDTESRSDDHKTE